MAVTQTTEDTTAFRRAVLGTIGFALLWALAAALRSTTTFHVAPGVVAVTWPYLRRLEQPPAGPGVVALDALVGAAAAVVATLVLDAVGWLQGPVLAGGGPVGEALIVIAGAAVVSLGLGWWRRRS